MSDTGLLILQVNRLVFGFVFFTESFIYYQYPRIKCVYIEMTISRKDYCMKRLLSILFIAIITLTACNNSTDVMPDGFNHRPTGWFESTSQGGIEIANIPATSPDWNRPLPDLPVIDGSSSTIQMHFAIRAFLTDEHFMVEHSRTYEALERLFPDSDSPADVLLAVRYHEDTLADAAEQGADLVITPIAREGFVFILHEDNPIDSLTQEQLQGIYSGRITNWSQVGGLNEKIVAFTRNWDSGSQTAMEEFMGDLTIVGQDDITQMATMGEMLFGVQEVGSVGIGYNIFSWSMLQNLEEMGLKTVAVDGINPSNDALSDGSYPLMVYTYSYYNRGNEKAEIFTEWLLTEQGQKVIASAGYVGINGQLPPPLKAEPDFNRDEFYSNRAVIEYYHSLESSRIERSPNWRRDWQIHEAYVQFEDGSEHRFNAFSYLVDDHELAQSFTNGQCKGVTVLRLADFVPTQASEKFRFVVLTRAKGEREFTVINEGLRRHFNEPFLEKRGHYSLTASHALGCGNWC
jgi:ABC-type phosphate transport system substrate-binding protein